MLVYQRVIVVSAIEIWYKHLDKMTLQVIYQQDLSLMILRVSIVSLFSPVFPFWMGCLLVEPPKIMLSFKPHWRNQDKSTYIYISYLFVKSWSLLFFWEELPPFFSTGDPLLDRRRSRRPPGARLAPAKVMILVQTSPRGQVRVTPRAGWFRMDDPTKMILNDLYI